MTIAYWILVGLMLLTGLVGSAVPLLPGTTLIMGGVLLQKWLLADTLSWAAVGWVAAVWLLSLVADLACTLIGARLLGGSKWGMAGASGGALAGMFISLPALILGTLLGAVAAEKLGAKRTHEEAWKSGAGAALGFLFGTVARVACAVVMIALYVFAVWPARG
ncbi:MAG TPA: DUF456 domain-containing protein [Lacunisphaera sp.]|nr:DUF456 domain-containing protein [Lacunisphaera sp.]